MPSASPAEGRTEKRHIRINGFSVNNVHDKPPRSNLPRELRTRLNRIRAGQDNRVIINYINGKSRRTLNAIVAQTSKRWNTYLVSERTGNFTGPLPSDGQDNGWTRSRHRLTPFGTEEKRCVPIRCYLTVLAYLSIYLTVCILYFIFYILFYEVIYLFVYSNCLLTSNK